MRSDQPLFDQIALVTGGGGGIGAGICQSLASAGATIIITYNNDEDKAAAVAASLPGGGHCIYKMQVDDSPQVQTVAADIEQRFGRLDILVNNAGMTQFVPLNDLDQLDDELIDRIFQVNWRGSFACARACRPLLEKGTDSLIVNITSVAAKLGAGSNIAYCASKAAMDNMTIALAQVLAPSIRVVSVAPGLVDGDYARSFDPAWRQAQIDRTPLGRLATPEDVGETVLAVAAYMPHATGCIIPVDGGRPLR
jgi:3-oxoacyl-[acyl-carrier protein] reductase